MAAVISEDVQVPAVPMNVPTTIETLVVAGQAISLPSDHAKAVIRAWLDFTPGVGATAVTLAIYSGPAIGGRLVGTKTPNAGDFTPGSASHFEFEVVDPLQGVGGAQYCMSVQQTAATGDGTIAGGLLDTTLLSG